MVYALARMAKVGKTVNTIATVGSAFNPGILVGKIALNVVTTVATKKIVQAIEKKQKPQK